MKKGFLILLLFLFGFNMANAGEYFFTNKCNDLASGCLYEQMKNLPYVVKIYNIVCIPCYSSMIEEKEPLFLKLVNSEDPESKGIFDEYNYKTSENELVRYI